MPNQELLSGARIFAGRHPRIIGHRGSAGTVPENTLPSFGQAVVDGADILELDVWLTADGHVVVMHDETVDRTTNGVGKIADLTLSQLKRLDAGFNFKSGNSFPFRGKDITVPTLPEVLLEFANISVSVEIKKNSDALIAAVIDVLKQCNRMDDGSIVVASFTHAVVRKVRKLAPQLITSFSTREVTRMVARAQLPVLRQRKRQRSRIFQVQWKRGSFVIVTKRLVKAVHKLGYEVHVWTINDPRAMHKLLDCGVDAIFTDHPALMSQVLQERTRPQ